MEAHMDVLIRSNYSEMSTEAARLVADLVRAKPNAVLGLPTGATPIGLYRELVRMHREEGLDFTYVRTFNLDELVGVGTELSRPYAQDPSFARFMWEELFRDAEIPVEQTYVPDGTAADLEAYSLWFEEEIRRLGGIDLQILGIGKNGHLGFNEPGTSLGSRTHVVVLTEETLDANYDTFYRQSGVSRDDMPHFGITMGVGTILEAKRLLLLASGDAKAEPVARALEGPVTSMLTASAIQLFGGQATVVLDEAAAAGLALAEYHAHVAAVKSRQRRA
jgi:glucosamine-6-phosphate deaminase